MSSPCQPWRASASQVLTGPPDRWMELPEIGVGVVYAPGLEPWLEAGADLVQVIEIEPQSFWVKARTPGAGYRLHRDAMACFGRYRQPKLIHGVGFPVGGSAPTDFDHLAPLVTTVEALAPPWVSEHLSFNRARRAGVEFNTGFLLPPLQTAEGVEQAAANIRRLKSALPVPFAFETGVNYLQPIPGEMSDGAFFRAIAESADCGIVLDLHNLWANERNGRRSVRDVVAEMPLERVWEVHLAGGEIFGGYWMDAHSSFTPTALWELAAEIVPRLPRLKALIFELMPHYINARGLGVEGFLDQLERMQALWDCRGRTAGMSDTPSPIACAEPARGELPTPATWEDTLGGLVISDRPAHTVEAPVRNDPGVEVLRHLVGTMRGGMAVTVLTLTCRLLMLELGEKRFSALLEAFWRSVPPEPFASEEAMNLAAYLRVHASAVPYLNEVIAFELATQQMLIDGTAPAVRFSCDPLPLLTALGNGRRPERFTEGEFELVLEPAA